MDDKFVGSGKFLYRRINSILKIPQHIEIGEVSAVGCDSTGDLIVYSRGKTKLSRFSQEGNFLNDLTIETMVNAHGLFIAPDDSLYCTDQVANKIFHIHPSGKLIQMLDGDHGLFDKPTDCCLDAGGNLLVSDGYGHRYIHRFSSELKWQEKWGDPEEGGMGLILPHCVRVDKGGRIFVCDRENDRVVVYSQVKDVFEVWDGFLRPSAMVLDDANDLIYVAELDYQVSIISYAGDRLCQFGQGRNENDEKVFTGFAHGIAVNSRGDIFVAETMVPRSVVKFERL